jgi:hypothetical protein
MELELPAVDVQSAAYGGWAEHEQTLQLVFRQARYGAVFPQERAHNGTSSDDLHSLLEEDLMKGAGIMVGMAMADYDGRYMGGRDAHLVKFDACKWRWVHHYPLAVHPKEVA